MNLTKQKHRKLSTKKKKKEEGRKRKKGIQCCHMLPARSSAFFVASAAFFPHFPSTSFTASILSTQKENQNAS
jgi:hypothetical protein